MTFTLLANELQPYRSVVFNNTGTQLNSTTSAWSIDFPRKYQSDNTYYRWLWSGFKQHTAFNIHNFDIKWSRSESKKCYEFGSFQHYSTQRYTWGAGNRKTHTNPISKILILSIVKRGFIECSFCLSLIMYITTIINIGYMHLTHLTNLD